MPVPKRKHSRARRDSRNANKGIDVQSFASCTNCGDALKPHIVCQGCGFYKGVKVLRTKSDRGLARDEVRKAKESRRDGQKPATQEPQQSE